MEGVILLPKTNGYQLEEPSLEQQSPTQDLTYPMIAYVLKQAVSLPSLEVMLRLGLSSSCMDHIEKWYFSNSSSLICSRARVKKIPLKITLEQKLGWKRRAWGKINLSSKQKAWDPQHRIRDKLMKSSTSMLKSLPKRYVWEEKWGGNVFIKFISNGCIIAKQSRHEL